MRVTVHSTAFSLLPTGSNVASHNSMHPIAVAVATVADVARSTAHRGSMEGRPTHEPASHHGTNSQAREWRHDGAAQMVGAPRRVRLWVWVCEVQHD